MSEGGSRASTRAATVAAPSEGLSPVAILLLASAAGLVVLLAGGLVRVVTRHAPSTGDLTAAPIPPPLITGPLIEVGTLDLRRARENRKTSGVGRGDAGHQVPGEERSAGDR